MTPAGTNPKIEELRFKVKTDPKSRLFYPLAEELRKAGQHAEAESVLRAGLNSHPTYLSAWVGLGRVLRDQKKFKEATEALTRALDLDRGNVVAARLLAESYVALGEKVEAIKKYKLVHALLPGDDEIEASIHRLEQELDQAPSKSVSLSEPPAEVFEQSEPAPPGEASDSDVFETTYSRLQREARLEVETGDSEPMSAAHSMSPFEDPAAEAGYTAEALEIERPEGVHLTATPLHADLPSPVPSPPLPPEEDAAIFEPAEEEIAPGFIQGKFDANVAPPPIDEEMFARTITMADLYASQGLVEEARDIYEDVLARDPNNAIVRAKLDALESSPAKPPVEPPSEADEDATLELRSGLKYIPEPPRAQPLPPPPAPEQPEPRTAPEPAALQPEPAPAVSAAPEPSPVPSPVSKVRVEKLQSWLTKVKRPGAGRV
jgi:tetratricopeptide (TPR) repeat protein